MIPFRYLVVSLAMVILALAAGVLLGGTVVDPALQTRVSQQVDRLTKQIDEYRKEVTQSQAALNQWERYGDLTLKGLVAGQLAGSSVVIVADQNVDPSASQEARQVLTDAGANLVGVIEVLPPMTLTDGGDRSSLAGIIGLDPNDPPADLAAQAAQALADRLEGPSPGQDDLLTTLSDSGFIALPQLGQGGLAAIAGPGQGVVVLAGGAKQPAVQPDGFLLPLMASLDAATSPAPVVAAEPTDTIPAFVELVREGDLEGRVSTVDDLDMVFGRFSLAVALHDQIVAPGQGTDYGVKQHANALFPTP
jgi:Copper transport outer membrane protein, MctB